jgi:outer membrane protein assembly factor BamB
MYYLRVYMKKILVVVLIAILMCSSVGLSRAELYSWAQLGGNSMREGKADVMPDVSKLEVIWESYITYPEDGASMMVKSAPISNGSQVFVASADIARQRGLVVTVDEQTGKIETFSTSDAPFLSTPLIAGENLYITSGHYIFEQELSGKSNRSILLAPESKATATECSALFNGTYAFFGYGSYESNLICFQTEDSSKLWRAEVPVDINCDICSGDGKVFAIAVDRNIYAIHDFTGEVVWKVNLNEDPSASPIVVGPQLIVAESKFGMRGFDTDNGDLLWETEMPDASAMPCTDGRLIFVGTSDGFMYSIRESTGEIVWKTDTGAKITSAPVYAVGMVCFGNENGEFIFLDSESGNVIRKFQFDSMPSNQALVLNDRIIIACSNGHIICLGEPDEVVDPPEEPERLPAKIKVIAPQEVVVDDQIEITVDIEGAYQLCRSEFSLVYDSDELEYVSASAGRFLGDTPYMETDVYSNEIAVSINNSNETDCPSGDGRLARFLFIPMVEGNHTITILDAIHTRKGDISSIPQPEPTTFTAIVKDIPTAEVLLTPESVNLGLITEKKTQWLKLTQKNSDQTEFKVRVSDERMSYNPETGMIGGNDYIDIFVEIDPNLFDEGRKYQLVLSVNIAGITLRSDIFFTTPQEDLSEPEPEPKPVEPPSCIDVEPAILDFGFIPRGREISIDFKLSFDTDEELVGKITTDKPWLRVSPATFSTRGKTVSGIVTISASELPGGEEFIGHLNIESLEMICQSVTVEARVQTQPSIILEMDIGCKPASIGSLKVDLDQPPIIRNDRTLVPIRFVSEAFGSKVQWEASTRKVTITRFADSIILWIGKKSAIVNGSHVQLDVEPSIENGSTLVPIRFISESFGANVEWFGQTKHIKITYVPPPDFSP